MGDENALGSFLRAREKNDHLSLKLNEYLYNLEDEKRLWNFTNNNVLFEEKKLAWRLKTESKELKKRGEDKKRKESHLGLKGWAKVKKKTTFMTKLIDLGKAASSKKNDGDMTANKMSLFSRIRTFVDDCEEKVSEADERPRDSRRKSRSAESSAVVFEEKPQRKKSQSLVDLSKWAGNPNYTASIRRPRLDPGRLVTRENSMTFVRKMFRDQHLKKHECKRNHEKRNGVGEETADVTLSLPEIKRVLRGRMEALSEEDLSILTELRTTGALALPKIDEKGENGDSKSKGDNDSMKSRTFITTIHGENANLGMPRRSISLPDIH